MANRVPKCRLLAVADRAPQANSRESPEQDKINQGTVRCHHHGNIFVKVHDVFAEIKGNLADVHKKKNLRYS